MNETAAGMTQTMPLYLIGIGVVLIFLLTFLLAKMRKSGKGEEKEPTVSHPAASSEMMPQTQRTEEAKEPEPVPEPEITVEAEEERRTDQSEMTGGLPVVTTAFEETPNVGRESFETFAGKQVLVVEDNPVNRKLILTLMAGSGIELDSAEDGVEALEKLRAPDAHYDLVLMDVNMPRMDGLECTRQIRADERLRSIPVLALTASTTQEEVDAILQSGMNGYLDKPINLGKLYTAFVRFTRDYTLPTVSSAGKTKVATDSSVLDTVVGQEHTNNDATLYRMLLEDFLQQYGTSDERFRALVDAKDYDGLLALIIDLEGLAGTLGAMELYGLVTQINQILDRGTTMLLGDYVDEYAHTFGRLKKEIEAYLAS